MHKGSKQPPPLAPPQDFIASLRGVHQHVYNNAWPYMNIQNLVATRRHAYSLRLSEWLN